MIGLLNAHSENSLKECPVLIPDLIRKAKEAGYLAVCLTDKASMTGIAEFIKEAKKNDIKPVPGVELAVSSDDEIFWITLIARDYTGYVGLCKILSEANKTIVNEIPVLDKNALQNFFSSDSIYHGHVAATSGNLSGELMQAICSKSIEQEKKTDLEKRLKELESVEEQIANTESAFESVQKELKELESSKKSLALKCGKNFSKKEEKVEKLKGTNAYDDAYSDLMKEKVEYEAMEKELARVKSRISHRKSSLKELKLKRNKLEEKKAEKEELQLLLFNPPTVLKDAREIAKWYQDIFGKENYFIDLMFHGLEKEAEAIPELLAISEELNIPTVLSNDVYILDGTEDDVLRWQIVKSLSDNTWKDMDITAPEYRLKTEAELSGMLLGLVSESVIEKSLHTMHQFFDSCSFEWPQEKHYPVYRDPQGRTSEKALEETCRLNIQKLFKPGEWDQEHEDRLNMELPVINKTGYADYTMIISDILKEGRKGKGDGALGSFIGPGRGSGAGSIVNYLMGITKIDPIKYQLIFERYLNVERISPPDIDSDIATSIRDRLVHSITEEYSTVKGRIGVCNIVTKNRLTAKAAIKAAGRSLSAKMFGNTAKLFPVADAISKAVPNEQHMTLDKCMNDLLAKFTGDDELEILRYAVLVEGVLCSYGTHAAGMIITDNGDVTDYAPVMNVGTNEEPSWNIQFDKEESESIGLLKLDALGLTSLDIISNTMQRVYKTRGIRIDIDHIPFEKNVFREIYGHGKTNGVFQCESPGMKRLWMQLKPDCIEDIIAGVALYRPGPMEFIPSYIEGKRNPNRIQYLTPELRPILENTYGCIIYQEQVMRIVRDLAGFSMGRSDLVRRAMSKKKDSIMNAERQNFIYGNAEEGIPGCVARGISPEIANQVYDLMIDFAKYAFNKSHAAAYAIVSYQTAWLKYHFPKEFLIEVMNQEKTGNIPLFVEECRRYNFDVIGPDINHSQFAYTEYEDKIIYGFSNVKGVKRDAEKIIKNRGKGYAGFGDFILRAGVNKRVVSALIMGGAFDCFCKSRSGLLFISEGLLGFAAKRRTLLSRVEEKKTKLDTATERRREQLLLYIDRDQKAAEELRKQILDFPMPHGFTDNMDEYLENEKNVLFTYISAHPLDQYLELLTDCDPLSSIKELQMQSRLVVAGEVTGLRKFRTKKEEDMCVFTLSDKTGTAKVLVWPNTYEKYQDVLKDGMVLKIAAMAKPDNHDTEEWVLIPEYITVPSSKMKQTLVLIRSASDWTSRVELLVKPYLIKQGSQLILFNQHNGQTVKTGLFVSPEILKSDIECREVRRYIPVKRI